MGSGCEKRYMPVKSDSGQRFRGVLRCDDTCCVFELSSSIFVPGAKSWSEILPLDEHSEVMRLFLFVIDKCIGIRTRVVLETLVSESDFKDVNSGQISETIDWKGFRLWIPLSSEAAADFEKLISDSIVEEATKQCLYASLVAGDVRNAKKRKIVVTAEDSKPSHLRGVKSVSELVQLTNLYATGRGQEVSASGSAAAVDALLLQTLEYQRYFSSTGFQDSVERGDVLGLQANPENYFADAHHTTFSPVEALRPLMREFKCGGDDGFLRSSASELMDYLLPHLTPSKEEIILKLERVLSSAGRYHDLRYLSYEDLVAKAAKFGVDVHSDPHGYSPIVLSEAELKDPSQRETVFSRLLLQTYSIVSSLQKKNRHAISHYSLSNNCNGVEDVVKRVCRDIHVLLSSKQIEGVPIVYGKLWKECNALTDIVRRKPECELDKIEQLARAMHNAKFTDTNNFTRLSVLINRLGIGAAHCLRLMRAQASTFITLYIASFGVTNFYRRVSQMFITTGPVGTGKSKLSSTVSDTVPQSIVFKRDSHSALADTGAGCDNDCKMLFIDECKMLTNTGTNDTHIKTEQSRMVDGYFVHERLEHDPLTGKYVKIRYAVIDRRCEITSTNRPSDIPEAIQDRSTMIPITHLETGLVPGELSMSANMSIATAENPVAKIEMAAWTLYLRHLSSLQIRMASHNAFGSLPDLNEHCFELFWLVLESVLGTKTMPPRRTVDLREMAINVNMINVLNTWHSGGLGEYYDYDEKIEVLWYQYSRYTLVYKFSVCMTCKQC